MVVVLERTSLQRQREKTREREREKEILPFFCLVSPFYRALVLCPYMCRSSETHSRILSPTTKEVEG
jgi:hypothetical protein